MTTLEIKIEGTVREVIAERGRYLDAADSRPTPENMATALTASKWVEDQVSAIVPTNPMDAAAMLVLAQELIADDCDPNVMGMLMNVQAYLTVCAGNTDTNNNNGGGTQGGKAMRLTAPTPPQIEDEGR